jgi:cyclopropane fatty-acyl-phospholipid synthase-like methyltransferase
MSIEMFEHMKNYEALFKKVSSWLKPRQAGSTPSNSDPGESLLFLQVFCHRSTPYHFEEGDGWMAQNFFSGKHRHVTRCCCVGHLTLAYRWNDALVRPLRE